METKKPLNAQDFVPYESRKKKTFSGCSTLKHLSSSLFLPLLFLLGILLIFITSGRARPVPMGPDMAALCLLSATCFLFFLFGGKLPRFSLLNLLGLGVALYFGLSALESPVQELGQEDASLVFIAFFFYPLGTALAGLKRGSFWLGLTFSLLVFLNVMSLIIQKNGYPRFLLGYPESVGPGMGIFTYYTMFGHFMGAVGLFSLFKGLWNPVLKAKLFWLLLCLTCLISLLICSSRGALVALAPGILVGGFLSLLYFYRAERAHFFKKSLFLLLFLLLLGVAGAFAVMALAQERPVAGMQDPLSGFFFSPVRTNLTQLGGLLADKAGLWGLGARSFEYEYFSVAQHLTYWFKETINLIHNEYAQILVEYGLIGLLLLGALFLSHLFKAALCLFKLPSKKGNIPYPPRLTQHALSLIGAGAALTYAFSHAYTDFVWHILPIATLSAFLLGLLAAPTPLLGEENTELNPPEAKAYDFKALLARLGLLALLAGTAFLSFSEAKTTLPLYFLRQKLLSLPPTASLKEKIPLKEQIAALSPQSLETLDYVRDYLEADRLTQELNRQSWGALLHVEPLLEKALEGYPQNPHTQLTYAYVLKEKENYKKADEVYAGLIAQTSEAGPHFDARTPYASFLLSRASHYDRLNRLPEMHSTIRRALLELQLGAQKRNPYTREKKNLLEELKKVEKHLKEQKIPLSPEIEEQKLY